jgi:hypothetical protein
LFNNAASSPEYIASSGRVNIEQLIQKAWKAVIMASLEIIYRHLASETQGELPSGWSVPQVEAFVVLSTVIHWTMKRL